MLNTGNKIFDDEGKFKKDIIPTLVGQLIQESFVTGFSTLTSQLRRQLLMNTLKQMILSTVTRLCDKRIFAEL